MNDFVIICLIFLTLACIIVSVSCWCSVIRLAKLFRQEVESTDNLGKMFLEHLKHHK